MEEQDKRATKREQPHTRSDRDRADERPSSRHDYAAGADGEQEIDVDAPTSGAKDNVRPGPEGSGW